MSTGVEKTVFYFDKKGPDNTQKTLEIALAGCKAWEISQIVVASSRGNTAMLLKEVADPALDIIADTLRMFCHGVKVCVEIAVMAAEHGYISPDKEVVAIAGSHHGADTAVVLKPAYAADMFKTKIKQLLCMPG